MRDNLQWVKLEKKGVKRQVIFGMVVTHDDGEERVHGVGGTWQPLLLVVGQETQLVAAAGCGEEHCSLLLPAVGRRTAAGLVCCRLFVRVREREEEREKKDGSRVLQGEGRVISLKTLAHPFYFVYLLIYIHLLARPN